MDLIDVFLKKINAEDDLKKPINALISFSKPETGKTLSLLAKDLIKSKVSKSSVVALHLITQEEADRIGDLEQYKTELFEEIIALCEKNGIAIRTFVKISDDYVSDILETEKTYDCNFLLIGIGKQVFNTSLWEKYLNSGKDTFVHLAAEAGNEAEEKLNVALTNISSLLSRNTTTTGVFVDRNFEEMDNVFIPILDKMDVHIFTFVNRLSFREKTSVMVWDAIGLIETNPEMKKLYQYLNKRTNGRLRSWNNDEKIDYEFIRSQDLIIIGTEGWNKLISSAIPWARSLPSTLIIKESKNEE